MNHCMKHFMNHRLNHWTNKSTRIAWALSLVLSHGLMVMLMPSLAQAQSPNYPAKPIKIIVPYATGGATDILARTVGERLSQRLNQTILVENKAGVGGIMGTDMVAKAPPDGYSLLMTLGTTVLINQFLYEKLHYTPSKDFALVSQIALAPVVLLVNANSSLKSAQDFKTHILKNPGKLSYGSWGVGSYAHLAGAYLSQSFNANMTHVAYKGEAPMLQDLVGGQFDFTFASAQSAKPYIDSGLLRALAVTGEQRMSVLPNVASMSEQGFKDDMFKVTGWLAVVAPAKTPNEIVQRISSELRAIVATPEMQERIYKMGFIPTGNTPEQFANLYKSEFPIWERIVKLTGAQLD